MPWDANTHRSFDMLPNQTEVASFFHFLIRELPYCGIIKSKDILIPGWHGGYYFITELK
jgi:hypothetical protein